MVENAGKADQSRKLTKTQNIMEALVKQLVESNLAQQAMHQELMEEQRHQTALLRAELS